MEASSDLPIADESPSVSLLPSPDNPHPYRSTEWYQWNGRKGNEKRWGDEASESDIDWSKFPQSASYSDEVDWVYLNFSFVVQRRDGKDSLIRLGKRVSDPPSQRCKTLLDAAANNSNQFFSGTVNKVMIDSGGGSNAIRHDRKLTGEIERALELLSDEL